MELLEHLWLDRFKSFMSPSRVVWLQHSVLINVSLDKGCVSRLVWSSLFSLISAWDHRLFLKIQEIKIFVIWCSLFLRCILYAGLLLKILCMLHKICINFIVNAYFRLLFSNQRIQRAFMQSFPCYGGTLKTDKVTLNNSFFWRMNVAVRDLL